MSDMLSKERCPQHSCGSLQTVLIVLNPVGESAGCFGQDDVGIRAVRVELQRLASELPLAPTVHLKSLKTQLLCPFGRRIGLCHKVIQRATDEKLLEGLADRAVVERMRGQDTTDVRELSFMSSLIRLKTRWIHSVGPGGASRSGMASVKTCGPSDVVTCLDQRPASISCSLVSAIACSKPSRNVSSFLEGRVACSWASYFITLG